MLSKRFVTFSWPAAGLAGVVALASVAVALGVLAPAATAHAPLQEPTASAATAPQGAEAAPDSPRASVREYLALCRKGRWDDAAAFLEVPAERSAEAGTLARRLKAVFDRHLWFDLDKISPRPEGDESDGLPPFIDEVGRIPNPGGLEEAVRVVRLEDAEHSRWIFSAATVEKVDTWFEALPDRWAVEYLPPQLLRPGPGELLWWQWLAMPLLLVIAWVIGMVLGGLTKLVLGSLVKRTNVSWDDLVLQRVGGPLTLAWTIAAVRVLVPWLGLYAPAEATINQALHIGLYFVFFWSLLRSVDVFRDAVGQSHWAAGRPGVRTLLPLGGRAVKLVIFGMAVVGVLSQMGFQVASLLAGLGIGGIALALAAQKTGENLFAAFSIGVDQPFVEGDTVRVDDIVGTVETIGLRSTRIRTLDRTLITLPNGRLAEMRLESITARDRIRLDALIGLVYGTTGAQMRAILAGFEQVLTSQPELWPDNVIVNFKQFGESSLDIEVSAWFRTTDFDEFRRIRERVLLAFMDVVQQQGSDFAFPTRTVHLVGQPRT